MGKRLKYPVEFFRLQLSFADILKTKSDLSYEEILFKNTALYVRCIGHSDEKLPDQDNPRWKKLLAHMPKNNRADYFYDKYSQFESTQEQPSTSQQSSCFHAYFHNIANKYELHFDPVDPHGNLSNSRKHARLAELKAMFSKLAPSSDGQTTLFVRSWLLNINAFNRLFPEEFSQKSVLWDSNNLTYDNTHWGQFLDKDGNFKENMAMDFRNNWESFPSNINLYFPLPARRSELPVQHFLKYYSVGLGK